MRHRIRRFIVSVVVHPDDVEPLLSNLARAFLAWTPATQPAHPLIFRLGLRLQLTVVNFT